MRRAFFSLVLLAAAAGAGGCDLFAPGVTGVLVESVTVEALDLDQPWDSPITNDLPDVYVDLFRENEGIYSPPIFRSRVQENVDAGDLPLFFEAAEPVRVDLDTPVFLHVSDRDGIGDDQMFASETIRFGDRYRDEEEGRASSVTLSGEGARVVVRFRWD